MDKVLSVLPYAFAIAAVVTGIAVLIRMVIRKVWSREESEDGPRAPTKEEIDALAFSLSQEEVHVPKCPCGNMATHAAPRLIRARTGWLRSYFGVAPLYRRVVPPISDPSDLIFCETHAHVADSMMDRFIYERIRAVLAEANERISVEAAAFETENLLEKIKKSFESPAKKKSESSQSQPPVRLLSS